MIDLFFQRTLLLIFGAMLALLFFNLGRYDAHHPIEVIDNYADKLS